MKTFSILLVAASALMSAGAADSPTLAVRLGYGADAKVLIINGDDAGMCHSANLATIECMEKGLMRSSTIMVPCPWFPEIAAYAKDHSDKNFGVHLCHTSEWGKYRWGPLAAKAEVPGLVDPEGYLWRGVEQVYEHATPEQALIEGRAQVKRALAAGVDVTHLDSHMGTLQLHPDYVKVYLQLASEFDLPVRMASQETLSSKGFPQLRESFAAKGILFPDYFVYEELKDEAKNVKGFWLNIVKNLKPGVTELYIHAGLPTDELKAISGTWQIRSRECEVFSQDAEMRQAISDNKVSLTGYRPIRDLQRKQRQGR